MKTSRWFLTRFMAVLFWAVVLGALVYYVVLPAVGFIGYRVVNIPLDHFERQVGTDASGDPDAVYYVARYDCRQAITRITGTPPDAVYWMIGIYDNRLQRIPGGHLNGSAIEVQEDGQFHITIQRLPGPLSNTLECGRHGSGLLMLRVFLPKDRMEDHAPTIERIPTS
jgi:hypothetical protein